MFLDIKELELSPLEFAEEFQPDVIDLGREARQSGLLQASGRAEVVAEHHGKHQVIKDIRLRGQLSAELELQCARCLEPVPQQVPEEAAKLILDGTGLVTLTMADAVETVLFES